MAKNKELIRLEFAIKNKNEKEIVWAINYCELRLKIAQNETAYNRKIWEKRIRELNNILIDN
jgi:hypothetical protein